MATAAIIIGGWCGGKEIVWWQAAKADPLSSHWSPTKSSKSTERSVALGPYGWMAAAYALRTKPCVNIDQVNFYRRWVIDNAPLKGCTPSNGLMTTSVSVAEAQI